MRDMERRPQGVPLRLLVCVYIANVVILPVPMAGSVGAGWRFRHAAGEYPFYLTAVDGNNIIDAAYVNWIAGGRICRRIREVLVEAKPPLLNYMHPPRHSARRVVLM